MTATICYHWVASEHWNGRRWELERQEGSVRMPVGRVVRFTGGSIEVALTEPRWKPLGSHFDSLGNAAEVLLRHAKKLKLTRIKRRWQWA